MAGLEQKPIRRTCPEAVLTAEGKPTPLLCGREHMGTVDTCPPCMLALADAFWAMMPLPSPIPGSRPAQPAPSQPKKRRNRPSRKRRAKGNDHG
jgi:hypothetical protein